MLRKSVYVLIDFFLVIPYNINCFYLGMQSMRNIKEDKLL